MFTYITNLKIILLGSLITLNQVKIWAGQVDVYIQYAFEHNLSMQQKQFDLEKSLHALKEARGYYLPNISLNAMYTLAKGGRTIDLPVGDMLNPVYNTLNRLTASQNFPQIENQSVQFNPNNFYDVKLRTSMPLVNFEIGYNKSIKRESISYQQATVNVYKRALVKDIKTAYYHYIQATDALKIYESALVLVQENVRVNQSLLKNGVRNATALTRAQAEQEKAEAMIIEQQNRVINAKAYFNFLLNRPLDEDIITDTLTWPDDAAKEEFASNERKREELYQLDYARNIYQLNEALQRSNKMPRLNAFLDAGAQDFNFNVNNKSLYLLGGINMQWDLFSGNRTNARIQQTKADKAALEKQYEEVDKMIRLQQLRAENDVHTAERKLESARAQMKLMERYYHDQFKLYKEGQLLYIELIDAQNQWITAQVQYSLAIADRQMAWAALEYSTASYDL